MISVMRIWRDLDLDFCFEERAESESAWEEVGSRGWRRWIGNIKGSKSKFDRLYLVITKINYACGQRKRTHSLSL